MFITITPFLEEMFITPFLEEMFIALFFEKILYLFVDLLNSIGYANRTITDDTLHNECLF